MMNASLKRLISNYPSLFVAFLATTVFALFKGPGRFPMIADDYGYAFFRASGRLALTDFNFLNRRPISTFLTYWLYRSELSEFSQSQFYVVFFLNAFGFATISRWMRPNSSLLIIGLLCLYPCFHEVLFMNLTLSWALGVVYWGFALISRKTAIRTFWMFLAIASLETYVIPILLLPYIKSMMGQKSETKKRTLAWFFALVVYFILKLVFNHFNPPEGYQLNYATVFQQAYNCFQFIWGVHFYKIYWFATILQVLAFAIIVYVCSSAEDLPLSKIALLLLLPFLATVPMWAVAYYAPRSVHGAVLLNLAILGAMTAPLKSAPRFLTIAGSMLFISYGSQLIVVDSIKEANATTFDAHQSAIVSELAKCPSLCALDVRLVSSGFHGDWVMPAIAYQSYVNWVAITHGFKQTIVLVEGPNL